MPHDNELSEKSNFSWHTRSREFYEKRFNNRHSKIVTDDIIQISFRIVFVDWLIDWWLTAAVSVYAAEFNRDFSN